MKAFLAALLMTSVVLSGGAAAQGFPSKPIRIVVPYAAGGTTDVMARLLQDPLSQLLGQPVVIDNKPGGGGTLGTREVARAPADGHTLVFSNNGPSSIMPFMQPDAGYDTVKDFAPVSLVSTAPLFVLVNAGVPVNSLTELVAYAKSRPGALEFSSAGVGSLGHLTTELFAQAAGIKLLHVPYRGGGPSANALVAGEVKLLISSLLPLLTENIQSGKLRLLAITSKDPSPLAPDVPTASTAVPNFSAEAWFGMLAPAGTPDEAIGRLNGAITKVLARADIQERYKGFGVVAKSSTPAELASIIKNESPAWAALIRERGFKAE